MWLREKKRKKKWNFQHLKCFYYGVVEKKISPSPACLLVRADKTADIEPFTIFDDVLQFKPYWQNLFTVDQSAFGHIGEAQDDLIQFLI